MKKNHFLELSRGRLLMTVKLQQVAQLEEEKKHLEYMNSIKKYDDQQVIINIIQRKLV